jgi:hypothetical protein
MSALRVVLSLAGSEPLSGLSAISRQGFALVLACGVHGALLLGPGHARSATANVEASAEPAVVWLALAEQADGPELSSSAPSGREEDASLPLKRTPRPAKPRKNAASEVRSAAAEPPVEAVQAQPLPAIPTAEPLAVPADGVTASADDKGTAVLSGPSDDPSSGERDAAPSGGGQAGTGRASHSALAGYLQLIRTRIAAAQSYPEDARRRNMEGTVLAELRFRADRRLELVQLDARGAHPSLLAAARSAVEHALRTAPVAPEAPAGARVRLPIAFHLRTSGE